MKIVAAILMAVLVGAGQAFAHEPHEHPAGPGLFGHPPEHIHVLVNPMPVYGMMIGVLALAAGLLARSRPAKILALSIIVVAATSAWPAHYFGKNAYQNVRKISDEEGQHWLDEHMRRAEKFLPLFYGTALVGIATLVTQRKFPRTTTALTIITLLMSLASAGVGGWISRAGGHIRHPEFRHGEASSPTGAHQHGERKDSDETMHHRHQQQQTQPADGHAGHKPETTPGKTSFEKARLPDTLEGTWTTIHQHHGELEAAITGKKFSEVQTHAEHLTALTKRLVELSHADHKAAVESGANKVNQILAELKQSAETGSETVLKNNLDAFLKSLNDLEQQMKKQ